MFEKCAAKLKPYIRKAVKSLGFSLDSYSEIVATVCNGSNGEVDHKDGNVSSLEHLVWHYLHFMFSFKSIIA